MSSLTELRTLLGGSSRVVGQVIQAMDGHVRIATPTGQIEVANTTLRVGDNVVIHNNQITRIAKGGGVVFQV